MLVEMYRPRLGRVEVGATGVALTAVAGEWLAHTLEYMHLWGASRAFGSVHVFMGPVGLVLAAAGVVGVHATIRLGRRLERYLSDVDLGVHNSPERSPNMSGRSWAVPTLIALVAVTQLGLFLLQENLEASATGRGVPGLSVLLAGHGAALVIHLAVAVALVSVLWLARREVTRLIEEIRVAEARVDFGRRQEPVLLPAAPARAFTPFDRWGVQLWSRPPPAPRVV